MPDVAAPVDTAAPAAATGPAEIATVQAWDPDGDNGTENDTQARLAIADGSSSTSWATECYQDQYMGGKRGVGLILGLTGPATGTLSLDSLNAPYQVDVYAATTEGAPADLSGWTQIGSTSFADAPGKIDAKIDVPATHLLVWLKELGADEACSSANPYRGRLGEITFVP